MAHSGPRALVNTVKKLPRFLIVACATDECENALAQFPRKSRHSGRSFSFERLSIQGSLARNDKIDILHFRFESDRFGHHIESRPNFCVAKTYQSKSESAGRAGSGFTAVVEIKLLGNNVSESR